MEPYKNFILNWLETLEISDKIVTIALINALDEWISESTLDSEIFQLGLQIIKEEIARNSAA